MTQDLNTYGILVESESPVRITTGAIAKTIDINVEYISANKCYIRLQAKKAKEELKLTAIGNGTKVSYNKAITKDSLDFYLQELIDNNTVENPKFLSLKFYNRRIIDGENVYILKTNKNWEIITVDSNYVSMGITFNTVKEVTKLCATFEYLNNGWQLNRVIFSGVYLDIVDKSL